MVRCQEGTGFHMFNIKLFLLTGRGKTLLSRFMAFNFFIASCKTVSCISIFSNFNVDTAIFAISVDIFPLIHKLVDVASDTFSSAAMFGVFVSYWINSNNLASRGILLYLEVTPILFTRPGCAIWISFDSFNCADTINETKYFRLHMTYLWSKVRELKERA